MACKTGSTALLIGALGAVTWAAASEYPSGLAENRGLSPIIQNLPHGTGLGDESDDPHPCLTNRADQRQRFIDSRRRNKRLRRVLS